MYVLNSRLRQRRYGERFIALMVIAALQPTVHADVAISVTDYSRLVEQHRNAIKSMQVAYKSTLTYDAILVEKGLLNGYTLEQSDTVAISGVKRYASTSQKALGMKGDVRPIDRIAAFNGDDCRIREAKIFTIQKEQSAYSALCPYFYAMLWPSTSQELEMAKREPEDCVFVPFMFSVGDWQAAQESLSVGETYCVLRTSDGSKSLWLDPRLEYALKRFVYINPVQGHSRWLFEYFDYVEVSQGIYLPKRVVATMDCVDPKTDRPIGQMRNEIKVSSLSINDVADSMFEIAPQPGEVVIDKIARTVTRFTPDDDDRLERSVREAVGRSLYDRTVIRKVVFTIASFVIALAASLWYYRRLN